MPEHAHFLVAAVGVAFAIVAVFVHGWLMVAAAVVAGLIVAAACLMYALGRRHAEPGTPNKASEQPLARTEITGIRGDQANIIGNEVKMQIFMSGDDD